jgi:hypothetical protein
MTTVGLKLPVVQSGSAARSQVLDAVEEAESAGDKKRAARLTELLDGKQITKALVLIHANKDAAKPPKKVDVPRTFHDHLTKAYSENYEACAKARVSAEIELLDSNLERMAKDVETARGRIKDPRRT